ncbi:hypothetical protein T03_4200 [Trichinella britovi]|uniref:Uncharacterized protein n=1 Tax=Trichinella britovi TaxID=45882 RepID=A0A0V0ZDX6_TRIBR|nr:hypothetical protein T03_4200 [Trichinella britovi]
MDVLWTAESRAKKHQPDKNTQETQGRLVTVNETCSDFIKQARIDKAIHPC